MGKYQRMHNVVGFVCNLHEFIKYLSAIFFPSPLVFLSAFYEKLKFTAKFFYDVIISPPSMLPTISPSKDYKKRDWLVVVLLWLFMGKCWIFVMYANEPRKRSDARRTTQKKKSDLLELDALRAKPSCTFTESHAHSDIKHSSVWYMDGCKWANIINSRRSSKSQILRQMSHTSLRHILRSS